MPSTQAARKFPLVILALRTSVVCAVLLVSHPAAAAPPAEWDGLVRIENKQLDHVYVLPEADLAGYKRIRLDPADVSFDRNWNPNAGQPSAARRLSSADVEKIKSTVASEFRKVFRAELAKAGYVLVELDGDDVLRVVPKIVNLYITAPEKMSAGRSRTYVTNSGHLTLVVELRDSVSGQFLARAVDTVRGRDTATFRLSSSVSNLADARAAFAKWAKILVAGLNDANASAAAK